MNKNVKKTLLFFAVLILVIVIIAAVYLLLLAPDGDSGETPALPETASASPSESPDVPAETLSPAEEGYTREETADGTIYHLTAPGEPLTYAVTVDEQAFELTDTDGRFLFQSKADRHGYLEFSFIEDSAALKLAPSFLDTYMEYNEFEQSGKNYIGGTEISGETVTVNDGKTQIEAWLVDMEKGVLAVVISYSLLEKETQKAALVKILDSLVIKM